MEEKNINQQIQADGNNSNIVFGTSSDDIQQGLYNNQFIDTTPEPGDGDKDQIVNEEEQNEIVNPSEEVFNEEPATQTVAKDNKTVDEVHNQLKEKVIDVDYDEDAIYRAGKISKAED
jgi:hypothetical protein